MTREFQSGEKIGPYRVLGALGQGGMGTVYEVVHEKLGVHYALKTFTLESGHAELFRKRFLAEGKVLARMRHEHIVRVFDLDVCGDSETAYFVMDLVHYKNGETHSLADLEPGGADNEHLTRWFAQLASAIDYVHELGIVHRDIKLDNILLDDRGGVMLGDFGISKFLGEEIRSEIGVSRTSAVGDDGQSTRNLIVGTAGYMAPEILRGEGASAASDTYALGVTFFRLLTGMWYEPGTEAFRLLEPIDGRWMQILPRMLDADPAKRPVKLAPLAGELSADKPGSSSKSYRYVFVGGVLVMLALLGAGGWFWMREPRGAGKVMVGERKNLPEKIALSIADGVSTDLIHCPPQSFAMSNAVGAFDGTNTHQVVLMRDFWVATSRIPAQLISGKGLDAAVEYISGLNRRSAADLPRGTVLRLPTEAEWEAAVQANIIVTDSVFEGTSDMVSGRYAKKSAWKSELSALVYAATETDPHRTAVVAPAWVCRHGRYKRALVRPDSGGIEVRLVIGYPLQ